MLERFENKYQEIAEQMKSQPWMQVMPRTSELRKLWNVDRWVAGAFSTYAVERMNGKNEEDSLAYAQKMNFRADLSDPAGIETERTFKDTPEAKNHFDKLARS